MKRKRIWIARRPLLGVLMCVLLCLGMGDVKTLDGEMPPAMRGPMSEGTGQDRGPFGIHQMVRFHMADISLDVREIDDFLLTPALLVQEAVSDGVVLTYPEE